MLDVDEQSIGAGAKELREVIAEARAVLRAIEEQASSAAEYAEQRWLTGGLVPAPSQLGGLAEAFGEIQALARAGDRSVAFARKLAAVVQAG